MESTLHLAQINIAQMIGKTMQDDVMIEFVAQLDEVNAIAESSKGFIWRFQDEGNDATYLNPHKDDQIIVNLSVWESIDDLEAFVYKGRHVDVLKKRSYWFKRLSQPFVAMWYIPVGHTPTVAEARDRIEHLQKNGATLFAFDFKTKFQKPY